MLETRERKRNKIQMRFAAPLLVLLGARAWAAPIGPVAKAVIPSYVQQIISIDYGTAKKFDGAMTLKAQVLPENLRKFENALKQLNVNPDKDLSSLVFASFDNRKASFENRKKGLNTVAVVAGSFSWQSLLKTSLQQVKPAKYNNDELYPLSETMAVTSLNDTTLLLGSSRALQVVLSLRDHPNSNVDSNAQITEMTKSVEKSTVWSVLDERGTQNMLLSSLGDASKLVDFVGVERQLQGSYYTMNFKLGLHLDVVVLTSDNATATKLSSLLKAGVLYKKVTANPDQRTALDKVSVKSDRLPVAADAASTSDRSFMRMRFKVSHEQFQSLLHSGCFTGVSSERKELSGVTSEEVTEEPKSVAASSPRIE